MKLSFTDYKCVTMPNVRINGTLMAEAQPGSFRRVVPHGEDLCWLTEALCVRNAFLRTTAPVTYTNNDGTLNPYQFYRGPHAYASALTNQVAADISLPANLVKAYNSFWTRRRFFYKPYYPGGQDQVFEGTSGTSLANIAPGHFYGPSGWGPGYPITELDEIHPVRPRVVGDSIFSMETTMLQYGLATNVTYDIAADLGFTGSVEDHRAAGHGPSPIPTVADYENHKYLVYYECRGFYGGGRRDYYVVHGHATNPLTVSLGATCGALRGHVAHVKPVYRYVSHYEHWEGSGTPYQQYGGQTVLIPGNTSYSVAADGTVTLKPYTDVGYFPMYGGNLNYSTPPGATSVSDEKEFVHTWWATLEGVELTVKFNDEVSWVSN